MIVFLCVYLWWVVWACWSGMVACGQCNWFRFQVLFLFPLTATLRHPDNHCSLRDKQALLTTPLTPSNYATRYVHLKKEPSQELQLLTRTGKFTWYSCTAYQRSMRRLTRKHRSWKNQRSSTGRSQLAHETLLHGRSIHNPRSRASPERFSHSTYF